MEPSKAEEITYPIPTFTLYATYTYTLIMVYNGRRKMSLLSPGLP